MAVPSVVKFKKGGVEYVSAVDRTQYTLRELSRAALRDSGKLVRNRFRKAYYGKFKKNKKRVYKYTQYWVRCGETTLQVGLKPGGFYGGYQELGTSKQPRLGLLRGVVEESIPEIIKIQSQYLSALEDEAKALSMIDESEMEGGADE